ncbi:MAG: putative extracellular nuclease [Gammaproteobacteria bacterium]|jgi:predicted extracellular nuclease
MNARTAFLIGAILFWANSSVGFAEVEFSIASINAYRLFDDVDDNNKVPVNNSVKFKNKISKIGLKIISVLNSPDVIAFQEIENKNVLTQIADFIQRNVNVSYQAVFRDGNDRSGINIGFLVKTDFRIPLIIQLFRHQTFGGNKQILYSRPPLLIETCLKEVCLTILNLHLRSMRGIRGNSGKKVKVKRRKQAELLASWVESFQKNNPSQPLIILGDLNALKPPDQYVDVVGILTGNPDNRETELKGADLITSNLFDLTENIPIKSRYSYRFRGHNQQLDYLLVNRSLQQSLKHIQFIDIDRSISDHAALIARFTLTD